MAANRQAQANIDKTSAITGAIGAIGSLAGTAATNYTTANSFDYKNGTK